MRDFLIFATGLAFAVIISPLQATEVIYHHLTIQDFSSACLEAKKQLVLHPGDRSLWEAYIEVLAAQLSFQGDEKEMLSAWKNYSSVFKTAPEEDKQQKRLLECMAWGILNKGARSPSPVVRLYALLGALFGDDARGVKLLLQGLSDRDMRVRSVSLQLASRLQDVSLQKQIPLVLQKEKVPQVRIEAIKAIGQVGGVQGEKILLNLLMEKEKRREEKEAIIMALATFLESQESAKRSFLRDSLLKQSGMYSNFLASTAIRELIPHLFLQEEEDVCWEDLFPLLNDSCADVRQSALKALGLTRFKKIEKSDWMAKIHHLTKDPHPFVAITATWALTLQDPVLGQREFSFWLKNSNRNHQRLAAAALVTTGKYGGAYLEKALDDAEDPYVQMNLAVGLLGQGIAVDKACGVLYKGLIENRDRWMWKEEGGFRFLVPNHLNASSAQDFEGTNRMARLEILNLLAMMKHPDALPALRGFLQKTEWGVGGVASFLLLQEGDESTVALIQSLLSDPQPKVRLQAALVLAMWGIDGEAFLILQEGYSKADHGTKEKILEALGKTGHKKSISFLVERLQEGEPTLRLIAAAALLQCLYH